MTLVTKWNFLKAVKYPEPVGGFNDVIHSVSYEIVAYDDAAPEGPKGIFPGEPVVLPLPKEGEQFIAAASLTKADLLGFVKTLQGAAWCEAAEGIAISRYKAVVAPNEEFVPAS